MEEKINGQRGFAMSTDDKLDMIFNKLTEIENKQSKIENIEQLMKGTNDTVSRLQTKSNTHDDMLIVMNYRSMALEARSRSKNWTFRSLCECRNENRADLMYQFLNDQLHPDPESIVVERAHRLGPWQANKRQRPITIQFRDYSSVKKILGEVWLLREDFQY